MKTPPAHALPLGARIGNYEIVGFLGAGGFGITYKAYNPIVTKMAAIKEFFPETIASRSGVATALQVDAGQEAIHAWALEKFEKTTSHLAKLSHQNIVKIFDYYPGNNTGYMLMECLEGETLESWLRGLGAPPNPSELGRLMDPVLDALEYLHREQLIHRDISPDNIMLCADGRPVLIDFGATSVDRNAPGVQQARTVVIKRAGYTAPEQVVSEGALPTPAADIYSVGAVLYRALRGTPPLDSRDRNLDSGVGSPLHHVGLTERRPAGVSPTLAAAIDKCLMMRADLRPRTMRDARQSFDWSDYDASEGGGGPVNGRGGELPFSAVTDDYGSVLLDDDIDFGGNGEDRTVHRPGNAGGAPGQTAGGQPGPHIEPIFLQGGGAPGVSRISWGKLLMQIVVGILAFLGLIFIVALLANARAGAHSPTDRPGAAVALSGEAVNAGRC